MLPSEEPDPTRRPEAPAGRPKSIARISPSVPSRTLIRPVQTAGKIYRPNINYSWPGPLPGPFHGPLSGRPQAAEAPSADLQHLPICPLCGDVVLAGPELRVAERHTPLVDQPARLRARDPELLGDQRWEVDHAVAAERGLLDLLRRLVLHEDTLVGGFGAEIAAAIGEHLFEYLDAPVLRLGAMETPVPFHAALEKQFLPKSLPAGIRQAWKRSVASGCGAITSIRSAIENPGSSGSTTKAEMPRAPGASPVRANTV